MKSFKDTKGRTWSVDVTVDSIKRAKALTGVDLLGVGQGNAKLLAELSCDPIALVDVVFALMKPAADAAGVTDEDFGSAMAGDAIEDATNALMEGIVDFFRGGQRAALRAGLAKMEAARARAAEAALRQIEAIDLEALMGSGGSSTSSPGGSASTLGR